MRETIGAVVRKPVFRIKLIAISLLFVVSLIEQVSNNYIQSSGQQVGRMTVILLLMHTFSYFSFYLSVFFMSRKERFTPQEKEQACIDYIEGNRSRSEICRELYISTSTMNIPVRRVLPHENIQMVGLTTTELSNKTSNNWLNGIASDNNVIISAP